jgi:NhaA family Na+:H+ antiporter
MKITKLFRDFFESEKVGGLILIGCTLLSLFLANSNFSENYIHFWHTDINGHSLEIG